MSTNSSTHAAAGGRRRWAGLVGLTIGVSLIIVDSTILNVAVPAIADDLGLPEPARTQIAASITSSLGERPQLPPSASIDPAQLRTASAVGLSDGARIAGLVSAAFVLLGLAAALRLPADPGRRDERLSV